MDSSQENFELNIKNKITSREYNDNSFVKIKLYQQSLHSSPNLTSRIILNEIWQKNHESLDSKTINKILKSAQSLIHTSENIKTWKNSLSEVDSTTIFEKSIACCKRCNLNEAYTGFDQFINNKCKCANCLLCESKSNRTTNNETKSIPQKENSSSCQPVIFGDEQKLSFKPKFRPKHTLKKAVSSQLNVNSDVEDLKQHHNTDLFNIGTHVESSNPSSLSSIDREEEENKAHKSNVAKITFKTAKEALLASNPAARRTLGASRKAQGKFVSPMIGVQEKQERSDPIVTDDRLKHIDPKMIELIESEIIDNGTPVGWDDIAGLEMAKSVIQEAVVWPLLRPDIFTGLRRPPRGILLFGPPGTGKTLIGKCVAAQCNATFFSISASSLTSKWLGDGEKMVRALFAVASCHQPAVIFIDEIDSLLTQRSDSEHEATRRIKTEFLVQFDGAATGEDDRLLIVGATNRPQELDEAARRRLVKRLYIPLPDSHAREQIITNLLRNEMNELTQPDIQRVAGLTEGYSGADMKSLCSEAAMGPIRSVPLSQIVSIGRDQVRPVNAQDFINALQRVKPSVSQDDLGQYVKWNKTYGQGF